MRHVGSSFPDQESNPHPSHWKYRFLITELLRMSPSVSEGWFSRLASWPVSQLRGVSSGQQPPELFTCRFL